QHILIISIFGQVIDVGTCYVGGDRACSSPVCLLDSAVVGLFSPGVVGTEAEVPPSSSTGYRENVALGLRECLRILSRESVEDSVEALMREPSGFSHDPVSCQSVRQRR